MARFIVQIADAQLPRVIAAFQKIASGPFSVPNDVVVDQLWIENWIKQQLRLVVRNSERESAHSIAESNLPPDIT